MCSRDASCVIKDPSAGTVKVFIKPSSPRPVYASAYVSESTLTRLSILKSSENGFEIAEKDLEIRGAGDFFGTNQSGIPIWRFFKPSIDRKLIIKSKEASEKLVKDYDINKEKIDFLREVFYRNENFMNYFSV